MIKFASPRWAKMLMGLSGPSKKRLANFLPKDSTRVVGKELGRGVEGRVFPSFTGGGVGDTATKVFNDSPSFLYPPGLRPIPSPELGKITGGGKGVKKVFGDMSIDDRVKLMKQHPDLFPKVHGRHARGYTMEPLKEFGSGIGMFPSEARREIKRQVNLVRYQRQNYSDYLTGVQPKRLQAAETMLRELLKNRNANSAANSSLQRLSSALERRATLPYGNPITSGLERSSPPILPLGNRKVRLNDFGIYGETGDKKLHNIMMTRRGRAVVSDPVPQLVEPMTPSRFSAINREWDKLFGTSKSKNALTPSQQNAATLPRYNSASL